MIESVMTKRTASLDCESFPKLTGCQEPLRECWRQDVELDFTHGDKALILAARLGVKALPWEAWEVRLALAKDPDGSWAHPTYLLVCARQNGKSVIAEIVIMYMLLVLNARIIFTAQRWPTAQSIRNRMWGRMKGKSWVANRIHRNVNSAGMAEIEMKTGGRVQFSTRSADAGRGFDAVDLLICDEAYNLDESAMSAMAPIQTAAADPMTMFMSSPVNRDIHIKGLYLSEMRHKCLAGVEPGTRFAEYAAPEDRGVDDPEAWRLANPSYGVINTDKKMRGLRKKMSDDAFACEMLGWGRWYEIGEADDDFTPVFDLEQWGRLLEVDPSVTGECCVGLDVSPDGEHAAMCAALRTAKGAHLSLSPVRSMDRDALVAGVKRAVDQNDPAAVVLDPKTPASTLVNPLEKLGVEPERVSAGRVSAAWELLLLMVKEGTVTHDGDPRWSEMLAVARERESRSGRALERYSGEVAGLNAAAFALWGLFEFGEVSGKSLVKKPREYVPPAAVSAGAVAGVRSMSF
ncbi:hypothetical protein OS127_02910 [Corynebacterium sp. P6129]|uniref:hypothetical protein n=1 Tax=Corynebacterium antarcticum TaxID=2800405 RepID=UPI002260DF07|nr:hypothetical protein [Corynebacterium antarcticum]MCX7491480.1 hypothetical protein [Corynebacterium antarcticum]